MANKIRTDIAVTADGKAAIGEIGKITKAVEKSKVAVIDFKKRLSKINFSMGAAAAVGGIVAATAAVKSFVGVIDKYASQGDALAKMSRSMGMNAADLQKWQYVARRGGMSTEQFNNSLKKFSVNVSKAANGEKKYSDAFKAMGISLKDGNGKIKTNSQLLLEVSDAYEKITNAQDKAMVSEALFGRGSLGMANVFEGGSKAMQEMMDRRARIGGLFTPEDSANAEKFKDLMEDVSMVVEAIGVQLTSRLLPSLNQAINDFISWWGENGSNVIDKMKIGIDVVIESVKSLVGSFEGLFKCFDNLNLLSSVTLKDVKFVIKEIMDEIGKIVKWWAKIPIVGSALSAIGVNVDIGDGSPKKSDPYEGRRLSESDRNYFNPKEPQVANPAGVAATSSYTETKSTQTNRLDVNINGLNKESEVVPAPGFNFGVIDFSAGYAF